MECIEARLLLPERELGDLPRERVTEVERHLAACEACRARAAETSRAFAMLVEDAAAERRRPAPAVDLAAVIPASARRRRDARPARPWLAWSLRIAALALAAAGGAAFAQSAGSSRALREVPALVDGRVHLEVESTVSPMLRDVASWMVASEERHAREIALIAQWLDERRVDDATQLARALVATRADLEATQRAVFAVATQMPSPRPLPSTSPASSPASPR